MTNLNKMYDFLFSEASSLMKEYNPCKINDGYCACSSYNTNLCCTNCKYITKNGCKVESLLCKLWTCSCLENKLPEEFKKRQSRLFNIALNFGLLYMRGSKEDHIEISKDISNSIKSINQAGGIECFKINENKYVISLHNRDIRICDIPVRKNSSGIVVPSDFDMAKSNTENLDTDLYFHSRFTHY